jgi:hypothetical protein
VQNAENCEKVEGIFFILSFRVTRQKSRIGEAQLAATKKNGVAFSHLIFITKNNKRLLASSE